MEVDAHRVTQSSVKDSLNARKPLPSGITARRALQRSGAMADVARAEQSPTRAVEQEKWYVFL